MNRASLLATFGLFLAASAGAQEVRTAIAPDTVTPGGVFRVAIRVFVPRGTDVSFPDSLAVPADVEAAASRAVSRDSVNAETEAVTATYGLTAWKPGAFTLPAARVVTQREGRETSLDVPIPPLTVLSVLPVDTAGIEPRPPRDVIGPDRALLPLLLLAAFLVALAATVVYAFRRWRRRRPEQRAAVAPPRDRALAELERIRRSGLLESGEYKAYCVAVTDVVRAYLAEIEPAWSPDLTTSELAGVMRTDPVRHPARAAEDGVVAAHAENGAGNPAAVIRLLGAADLVKFTGIAGTAAGADSIWWQARDWVGSQDAGFRRAA